MSSSTAESSFCTLGGMMSMTSNNFISLSGSMPKDMPKDIASGAATVDASTNTTHDDHHGSDNNNGHNHSSSTNNDEDDNAMHNHDHSSHSMSTMSQGTVMYMDGFQSALFHNSQTPPPCLNFLHPTWTLHTQSKFIFAMLCVTLMGMLVEACGVWRVRCLRKGRTHRREQRLKRIRLWERAQRQLQQQQVPNMSGQEFQYRRRMQREVSELSNVSDNGEEERLLLIEEEEYDDGCPRSIRRIWSIVPSCIRNVCDKHVSGLDKQGNPKWIKIYDLGAASLHAARAWIGYLLMLAVMTYAVEFLFSAVFGMVFGRYWFVDMEGREDGGGVLGGAVGVGGGIGGAGLGEGGRQSSSEGVAMNDNDGTWGGGGDPCCGIDEGDEDNNEQPLREPLLGANTGVSRRPSTAFV